MRLNIGENCLLFQFQILSRTEQQKRAIAPGSTQCLNIGFVIAFCALIPAVQCFNVIFVVEQFFLRLNRIQNRIDGFKRQGVLIHQEADVVRMAVVGGGNIEEQVVSPWALSEERHDADVDRLEHLTDIEIASEYGVHVHGNEFDRKISSAFSHAVQGGIN